jgi:Glycosyl hydrolases family 18/Jacalin-like lectin domain
MNVSNKGVNAWIFLDEDNPSGTNYNDPTSCYQTLNTYDVYNATNMVNICFFVTVKKDETSYTLELGNKDTKHPSSIPGNHTTPTTQDYLQYVIRDAKAANSSMKFLATLGYSDTLLKNIFVSGQKDRVSAINFASNLVSYLGDNNLDGLDVDWEGAMIYSITTEQFTLLFKAIRKAFDDSGNKYYLTFSPAGTGNMVGTSVNETADWVNLQVYGGADPSQYTDIGVDRDLLAYGAKFESENSVEVAPHQTPQNAYAAYTQYSNAQTTQWRLNSGNYQSEQAYQIIYYQLIYGSGMSFDDANTIAVAGYPMISSLDIRHGDVINALQNINSGSFTFNGHSVTIDYQVPRHGGDSGQLTTIDIPSSDPLTEITITTGIWFGWNCVVQISFTSQNGVSYGPYGTMSHADNTCSTTYKESGKTLLGFKGTLVNVPLSSGPNTDILATLEAIFGG